MSATLEYEAQVKKHPSNINGKNLRGFMLYLPTDL
jgi:hypothetical protein